MLGEINITEWVKVFHEWKGRLKRNIDAEGEYLQNDSIDLSVFSQQEIFSGAGS
jgi:hypothetical protein